MWGVCVYLSRYGNTLEMLVKEKNECQSTQKNSPSITQKKYGHVQGRP